MKRKKLIISMVMNILIVLMVLVGTIFMMIGYKFMKGPDVLSTTGIALFKYYTVDSNVLVAISSIILIIFEWLLLNKEIKKIPKVVYLLKYISTVAVTLTFLVTLFYLVPALGDKFWFLYQNSNMFFHFLVPIFSFISFAFFEKSNLSFRCTYYSISTMIIYGIFYLINVLVHQVNGKVSLEYDWYGFVKGGVFSIFILFIVMIAVTYFIGWAIYKINKIEQ